MSAALNIRSAADTSTQSAGTHPDLSLGSINSSSFSTPAKHPLRVPSASSATTAASSIPIATPSPTASPLISRSKSDGPSISRKEREKIGISFASGSPPPSTDGDLLDTPGGEKRWGDNAETPVASRTKRSSRTSAGGSKGVTLTLRDQEKVSSF
jgi:hypothetical protein